MDIKDKKNSNVNGKCYVMAQILDDSKEKLIQDQEDIDAMFLSLIDD